MASGTILIAVENKTNKQLLVDVLNQYHTVRAMDTKDEIQSSSIFDLIIVDGMTLKRLRTQIQRWKEFNRNVFLPILLISSRQDIGIVTNQLWQNIDEIIFSPIEKIELLARVEILLRTRAYSVDLEAQYRNAKDTATIEERLRIARELHDSVSQMLFLASTLAQTVPRIQQTNPDLAAQQLEEISQLNRAALSEMRLLLLEMRPGNLARISFEELIHQLVIAAQGHKPITIRVDIDEIGVLPETIHLTLYRITQEALNNVIKHSQATTVSITLHVTDGKLELRIKDNGQGFDPEKNTTRLGLEGIRERTALTGATFTIHSVPNSQGTEMIVSQPLPEDLASRIG